MSLSANSSDELLMNECVQENRLAQKYLYQKYYGKMLGIPLRYTNSREEAIEVLNSAFMKVFESLKDHEKITNLAGWIARIVYRTAIDHIRRNISYKNIFDFNYEKEQAVQNNAIDNMAVEEIYALIKQLPTSTKIVFNMYAIEGYKHAEIAEQLEIPINTSKWHLSKARKILQSLIINNTIK